jgi:apolipoprotein N-acyltransferase
VTQTEARTTTEAPANPVGAETAAQKRRLPGLRLALLAGVLLWLACPPVTAWPLAWIAVAPLIVSVTTARHLRQALWRGYLFGWAFLGPVWYWVGLTIVGWTGSAIGWVAWFGLTLILAGFYAAWAGIAWWLARRAQGGGLIVGLAAAWVVMEWARTLGALSMPWAQLSYTQYRFLPILQIADITGAYGVSFLMMLVNGAFALWWLNRKHSHRMRWVWAALTLTVFCGLYGVARLHEPEEGPTVTVAAMQANFPMRSQADSLTRGLRTFADLTRQAYAAAPEPPALYVWSETASPGDAVNDPEVREALLTLAHTYQAPVLVGSRVFDPQSRMESSASVLFPAEGETPTRYNKQQLVPFGEYIPFRQSLPAFLDDTFHFFTYDVTPGAGPTVLRFTDRRAGTVALGPFICYEAMYPAYPRAMTRAGANLLVTQSNDGWFRSKAAMEQHLAGVVLRAIENRREVVRSTMTGITCFLDAKGRVLARAPLDTPTFLIRPARLLRGRTLYTRLGDWFVGLCGLLVAAALWPRKARNRRGTETRRNHGEKQEETGAA